MGLAALLAVVAVAGCSRKRTIGRDEVRSEIRSAISFVAESEMFVDYIRQGHATRHYAEEHAAYLEDAVEQSAKELEQGTPEPGTENAVHECRIQLELLCHELSGIRAAIGNNNALAAAKERMGSIRARLEKANSSL